jgi:hypothetical protein
LNSLPHVYKVRPLKDRRGFDLISDALPFRRLWYAEPNAVRERYRIRGAPQPITDAVIRVYDEAGNVIETHQHAGEFKEW